MTLAAQADSAGCGLTGWSETLTRAKKHRARPEPPTQTAVPAQPRRQPRHPARPRARAHPDRRPAPRPRLPRHEYPLTEAEARRGPARSTGEAGISRSGPSRTAWRRCAGGRRRSTGRTSSRGPTTTTASRSGALSSNGSKAKTIDVTDLEKVRDPHVRMSLELQSAFGLRREEAIKFVPSYADKGDHLLLKASWTKGGKARTIPVRTAGAARRPGPSPSPRRERVPHPERSQLPPAATRLRAPHRQRRALQPPWAATPIRADPLRGADRVEGPGRGRTTDEDAQHRSASFGSTGAADHQPGARSRAPVDSGGLLWIAGCSTRRDSASPMRPGIAGRVRSTGI